MFYESLKFLYETIKPSSETIVLFYETPIFSPIYYILIGDPIILIGISEKNKRVSCENIGVSNENIRVSVKAAGGVSNSSPMLMISSRT